MLFLVNDVVFRLDGVAVGSRLDGRKFRGLSLPAIIRMGQELYASEPLLQHSKPEQAQRLGALIASRAPMINAALFVAPAFDCAPEEVTARFVSVEFGMMADLYSAQRAGELDVITADRRVWGRLAA